MCAAGFAAATREPPLNPAPPPRILPATDAAIAEAAQAIRAGRLVAFPTETVYGLGADATIERAIAAVFAAKDRPQFNPLIVHVPDIAQARALVQFDARALALAAAFWPGPLSLVLPRALGCSVSRLVSAGLDTLAVRVPDHAVARALLAASARPIAAPSANPSGRASPTTAAHVAAMLGGRVDLILDGGPCRIGLESTVLDLGGAVPRILRAGAVAPEDIVRCLGERVADASGAVAADGAERLSPGMSSRHYAPTIPLRLDAKGARAGEALLAFGPDAPKTAGAVSLNLSPTGDVVEAAANLFAMLHALDKPWVTAIAVMPIPERGLGRAINDRLRRAAAPES
ncbi:MAG: threonylcarbamoyl-AMP synthase [Rhodospirillales bacterium]|nr:threonylcarbamoyl-AMP synthase [Rhodospirillales bacterium]